MYSSNQHSMFIVLFSLLVLLPFYEADSYDFTKCIPKEHYCGVQQYEIYYPFRLAGSPDYCGHPGFDVACNDADMTLLANFTGKNYTVKGIDYAHRIISVIDPSLATGDSCPGNLANYTLNSSLLRYSDDDVNVTVFLNCSSTMQVSPVFHNITCLATETGGNNSFYVLPGENLSPPADVWEKCSAVATIPIYYQDIVDMGSTFDPAVSGNILTVFQEGFSLQWKVGDWCESCNDSGGLCWYDSSSPNAMSCYCSDSRSIGGKCVPTASKSKHAGIKSHEKIIIGATGGFTVILFIMFVLLRVGRTKFHNWNIFWRKNKDINKNVEAFLENYGSLAPKRYMYSDVKKITNSFRNKLGQGGYGSVYEGSLSDGRLVAVKVLSKTKGNGEDFVNEIASIGRTSHVNVVNLLGFCSEGSKRALIYEYMCNGSLDKLISLEKPKTTLDWEKFYQIATGIARGLEYLHRGCNTRIVHFDIKPHNILLDKDLCPKISDFGLAKLCLRNDSILSMEGMRGTIGYIAPEIFSRNFGTVSSKADIYSYGMMVLEMAGGKKNMHSDVENTSENYFPHWIYKYLEENEDLQAYGATGETEGLARKMILVGLWCIQTMPQNRPSINRVIEMLEGSIDDLQIPPKPLLSFPSPSGSVMGSSSICDGCTSGRSSAVP